MTAFLKGQRSLLVIDNCEHVLESASELIAELLARCPELRVLATSRQPLGVEGEVTWRTEPLFIGQAGAVQLFLDRARAARPSLEVTSETESLVLEVCRRLAGLPLAIELAAARLRMMSLSHLSERLDDKFELLTEGPARSVGHHHALRATLDWSYRLLDLPEQALFRRLAVVRGGFTLETVERFQEIFGAAEGKAVQLLGHLVDSSMVVPGSDDRFSMLEPIRQYGLLLLDEHGENTDARETHALLYREVFRVPDSVLFAPSFQVQGIAERFIAEMDNVRAALAWALDAGDTATALELGAVAGSLFGEVGSLKEAQGWLDRVLSGTSEATSHRARALTRACFLNAMLDGVDQAEPLVDELAAVAEALDDEQWRAASVARRAMLEGLRDSGDRSLRLYEEAAERLLRLDHPDSVFVLGNSFRLLLDAADYDKARVVAERVGDMGSRFDVPFVVAQSLEMHCLLALARGDADAAERSISAAENYGGAVQSDSLGSMVLRGYIAVLRDDLDEAERLGSDAITRASRRRRPDVMSGAVALVGAAHLFGGDVATAHRFLTEALRESTRLQLRSRQRELLGPVAATLVTTDPSRCATLLGALEENNRRKGITAVYIVARAVAQATAALKESLPADELEKAWQRGAAMTLDDAIALAL